MKRNKTIEHDLKMLGKRVGWLPGQEHLLFWGEGIAIFSLADAIQAILDHLGMELEHRPSIPSGARLVKKNK